MHAKKILALSLATVLSLGALAGCSSSSSSTNTATSTTGGATSTATSAATSDDNVTLTWAAWDTSTDKNYQALADAYMSTNPNVTINIMEIASGDYMTDLSTQLAGGADIDVMSLKDIPGYNNLIKQGHLEPLSATVADAGVDTSVYNGLVEQITVDNEYYGLPYRSDTWVIFYNKDLFDAAGVEYPTNDMTIEEYGELARTMTSGSGSEKVYGAHFHTWRSTTQLWSILDGEHTVVDGNYDFMADTYEWVLGLQDDGIVMDYAELTTSSTHYSGVFYNEQVAMLNMGSWFITSLVQAVESGEAREDLRWGMVRYPHPEGVEAGTTLGTVTSIGINSSIDDAKKAAAFDFISFVAGAEGAAILAGNGATPAIFDESTIEIFAGIDGFPDDDNSKEALIATQKYLEFPLHDNASEIEVALNEEHAEIMMGNKTIEEGLEEMNTRVGEILG